MGSGLMKCVIELRTSWIGEPNGVFICNSKKQAIETIKASGFRLSGGNYYRRINGVAYYAYIRAETQINFKAFIEIIEEVKND
jgi:hypothetical protein